MARELFIGLMTGTSLDGVDIALLAIDDQQLQLLDSLELPMPPTLYQNLSALCQSGADEIERLGRADRQLARLYAEGCQQLLDNNRLTPNDIAAIGSHGQTIRHAPGGGDGFTLQIGDPNTLAQLSGITTVADFRRRDIAAGGQGAPLAPLFHAAAFGTTTHNRAIINIGGIANVSWLDKTGKVSGYDTGPGNVLMNGWIEQQLGKPYDRDGRWAASGEVIPELLEQLLGHDYFSAPPPKSTGRELFNLAWLNGLLSADHYRPQDIQATLLELTAQSISREFTHAGAGYNEIYFCGGGAYNKQLMLRLETLLHPRLVTSTASLGIAPEWVEAACFGWLARQTLHRNAVATPAITGAESAVILGGVYYV